MHPPQPLRFHSNPTTEANRPQLLRLAVAVAVVVLVVGLAVEVYRFDRPPPLFVRVLRSNRPLRANRLPCMHHRNHRREQWRRILRPHMFALNLMFRANRNHPIELAINPRFILFSFRLVCVQTRFLFVSAVVVSSTVKSLALLFFFLFVSFITVCLFFVCACCLLPLCWLIASQ